MCKIPVKTPGSREVVDFGREIGIYIKDGACPGVPTSRGTIHYGTEGIHIVPAPPRASGTKGEMNMENVPMAYRLRASIQRALLGEVDARMVAVTCGVAGSVIKVRSYVYRPVTPKDIDRIQVVGTEVITDFIDQGYIIEAECFPVGLTKPECLDFFAFYRADSSVS